MQLLWQSWIYKSRSRRSLCDAEWTSSSNLYKDIQFQPAKLWIIILCFWSSASRACSSESGNVDKKVLNDIANGLKKENPYCNDLHHLGISVRQGGLTADANVVHRIINQPPYMSMSVCAVMTCRQTGVMSLQVTTTNGSISDVKMNSEKVEGLCYPLLFPHGEPRFTNEMKDLMDLRGAPTTCHNQHGASRSYSFGKIWADCKQIFVLIPMWFLRILAFWARPHRARVIYPM